MHYIHGSSLYVQIMLNFDAFYVKYLYFAQKTLDNLCCLIVFYKKNDPSSDAGCICAGGREAAANAD